MVVKKSYFKIIWREFKGSFGRFAAIFGIVALGVGFLSGLLVTTPDMHISVDEYYDKYNMADIFIKATKGLTEKDLMVIEDVAEIEETMPAYVTDALVETIITWEYKHQEFKTRGLDADQTEAAIKATMKMLNIIEQEYEI